MKTIVRRLMRATPFEIVRRDRGDVGDAMHGALAHNSREHMDALFGDRKFLAKYVTDGREHLHRATADIIRAVKPAESVAVIGDFGCGPGDFFNHLLPDYRHCSFHGYDFGNATLAAARERFPQGQFEQYDLYTAPPRQHDLTICSQTLEHLEDPDIALRHILAATAPGGVCVLTVPEGRKDTYRGHIQFWSPESWTAWVRRHVPQRHETRFIGKGSTRGGNLAAVIWQDG